MIPNRMKNVVFSAIFIILIFTSSILAYENYILQGATTSLRQELNDVTLNFKAIEDRYEQLLKEYEKLSSTHQHFFERYLSLNESYNALKMEHFIILKNYEKLMADYLELTTAYLLLNNSYTALLQRYEEQVKSYLELQGTYELISNKFEALQANFSLLKKAYDDVCFAMYRPLLSSDIITPTISELDDWLRQDTTDLIPYSKWDFICGDYAVMLSMHAKLNRWDMGIVLVIGRDSQGNTFNHVFNAIKCREGLVYIEPQNDQIFYGPITVSGWYYHPGFGMIHVENFIIVVPYQIPL
ncbi:MAG: hypothetical protein QW701_02275 [Candidatus Nezhaarchaeales archaeon]